MSYATSAEGAPLQGRKEQEMTVDDKPAVSYNAASAIAYFTFVPAVILLLVPRYKESPCVRFHAWQSILLFIATSAVDIVLGTIALLTPFMGTTAQAYSIRMFFLFSFVLWAACVVMASRGKRLKLPIIGGIAEKVSLK
ncbi:MAG: hypothetical protein JST28_09690 [Acidobacteria bacterium]|nr:hypothetical protein [Acidobacteriota bacterium]